MKTSTKGINLITHFEGLFLKSYLCPAGVWTIGYGHTGLTHQDGTVKRGRVITKEEAVNLLAHDLQAFENMVQGLLKVPVNQSQFDALVSFHFNTGSLGKSTLLKRINQGEHLTKNGDKAVSMEFFKWTKARDPKTRQLRTLKGLERRRRAEAQLFCGLIPTFE
jgi:lysozyme